MRRNVFRSLVIGVMVALLAACASPDGDGQGGSSGNAGFLTDYSLLAEPTWDDAVVSKVYIDPALAGGVILTTVTDVVGFLSFLGLATLVYS